MSGKGKKKWDHVKQNHEENNSSIPLYEKSSSVEKILGDADKECPHLGEDQNIKKTSFLSQAIPHQKTIKVLPPPSPQLP